MIDALYNYRQGEIHSAEFSDEFNKLCIPFEDSLNEEQIDVFHKLLDCVSETASAEMRAAYKVGFNDGAEMMREVMEYESNFFRYFAMNFNFLGLKKLIATCYTGSPIAVGSFL
ncbi:MAG: hypothetical protein BWZ04_00062 [Firmicutes bacterium ADurb.BinA205]|nr:MAG: hypothetical protein BWZ04_00062 [Firmicutes bacterium ADurb.BinA205]